MEEFKLLIDLHLNNYRQGPGGDAETRLALELGRVDRSRSLKVADIGCGTGASTLLLAKLLDARITAIDFLPEFLEVLQNQAKASGVAEKIKTLCCSMDDLPFADEELDIIWSEGSIYNIGYEKGVGYWQRFLKPGGLFVASEITWITDTRPEELQKHWDEEYPEVDVASGKIAILEKNGFSPLGYFYLPENCWLENYYQQLQQGFAAFIERNDNSEEAEAIVEAEKIEIELYEKYKEFFSYGFYIAKKMI